ncbi:MAG TPA: PhzF family phenazine biosynthesis protein [Rudaea sp.]|jgi:PhzF family phenazine biosynthesis protein|nr:PhzF family phenazine biosynthesis protein [Rudaea sp.]
MITFHYQQLDVFPAAHGGGNPLGVVIDARVFAPEQMQRFAAWTNLVETTFLLPPDDERASYRVRIFTPTKEIPFAGHPSIGSAHAALDTRFAKATDGRLIQQCGAGLLPIRIEGLHERRELFVQAPRATDVTAEARGADVLRSALVGRTLGALPPALINGGRRWWVAEFADEASVRTWKPDHAAIGELAKLDDCLGLCVFARCARSNYQLVVRAFPAGVGIVEDPASGAANGLIAAWIALREPEGALAHGYRVSQGREMGHDASISLRIDADGMVWVGGRTHTVTDRTLTWG